MTQSFTSASLPILVKALAFASRKHSHQRRKDADESPYINHPISLISILVIEAQIHDPDVLCGALLHDTIEDTETTTEELTEIFGGAIATVVSEVTDDKSLPKQERKRRQIDHAPHLSPNARLVKCADKIANLRDVADNPPADWPIDRRRDYFDLAKDVVDGMPDLPAQLRALFDATYERRP